MRFYTFTNYYLNTISQGIQPLHVLGRMFAKYQAHSEERATLYEWEAHHTTHISCSAGDYQGVLDAYEAVSRFGQALQLPFANFHEDQRSLGGLMTSCGIIVPTHIYETRDKLRADPQQLKLETSDALRALSPVELEFMTFLGQFGLAR